MRNEKETRVNMQNDPERLMAKQARKKGKFFYKCVKRLFDFWTSFIAIIVLLPVFFIVAILVYIGDPGPIIYGQTRIGKEGKPFKMWKFRSMYVNSDQKIDLLTPAQIQQYNTEFKIDNDPRITKIGNFLRKTSLDELPQLFNILFNNMSLVGPRPLVESEIHLYYQNNYSELLSTKPGLTGYWQAYARNNATYQSGVRQNMELFYARHASLLLDIKILFKTISSVLKRQGAK